jgi:hypothetical protein
VRISLELPGRALAVECRVDVALVKPGGEREIAWAIPAAVSKTAGSGQDVEVDLEAKVLRPGDYIATVSDPHGGAWETYLFRVTPPR